jgi:hypothetical protein
MNNIGLDAYLDRRHKEEQEQNRIDNINDLIAHDFDGLEFPNEIDIFFCQFEIGQLWYTLIDSKIVEFDSIRTQEGLLVECFETTWESIKHNYFRSRYFDAQEVYEDLVKNKNKIGIFVKVPYTNLIYVKKDDK